MAESTAQLQAKLKALTHGKVDIMVDADTFKNTTQILREMSMAWDDMTDIERAASLELMGGKRQANILSSVINNFETVEDVIQTSVNSQGSALAENEKWLDSIEGKTYQFTNALETMWSNMLSDGVVKKFIDFGTQMIKILDTAPGKITAITLALAAFSKFKGLSWMGLGKDASASLRNMGSANSVLTAIHNSTKQQGGANFDIRTMDPSNINAYAAAVNNLTAKQQANMLATTGMTKEQIRYALQCNGVKGELLDEATAHIRVKNAREQSRLSADQMTESNIRLSAASLRLSGDVNKVAIADVLEANASELVNQADREEIINKSNLSNENRRLAMAILSATDANKNYGNSLKGFAKANPQAMVGAVTAVMGLLATIVNEVIPSVEEMSEKLRESYDELQNNISVTKDEISSLDEELSTVQDRINELSEKNSLSFAEADELTRLKQQSRELEKQKQIQEDILEKREVQNEAKSLEMINDLLATTAANQQREAEKTTKAWSAVLGIITAIGAGIAGFYTGGATWAAVPAALSMAVGGAYAGSQLGSAIGGTIGAEGVSGETMGETLIAWYESYEDAIEAASQEATEAENKYFNDLSEKNYKKWQEKVDMVNQLQTEMYDGLQEMQGYIGDLEYTDQTSGIIDGYNNLMTHLSVKNMDGNTSAQIDSIKALEAEYESLSRGVDEHGNNVALTAEEYARYQSIVSQVLGYNVGLTETFTDIGGAVYDATGKQIGYNSVLEQTIKLLQEQQRQAAIDTIEGKDGNNPLWTNYKSAIKDQKTKKSEAAAISLPSTGELPLLALSGNTNKGIANEEISKIVGDKVNGIDGTNGFITRNIDEIVNNWDQISDNIVSRLKDMGYSDKEIQEGMSSFSKYISDVQKAVTASDKEINKFKKTLSIIPQMSDYYYELSGAQLAFVNDYISSLELTNDMSKKEIEEMKNNILNLVNTIGADENLKESVNELMTLDQSKMPVEAYTKKFEELWDEVSSSIPEEQRDKLLSQLFPDQSKVDKMLEDVGAKLEKSSRGLVGSLSLSDLQTAFREIIPNLDEEISFEELKAKIAELSAGIDGPIIQTFSTLTEQINSFNEVVRQTSEITLNNTKVTQDYKDSLVALGISEEELGECFDATNSLVVTNVDKLNELVKSAQKNTSQNISLAKSQARLQYYELYKKMSGYIGAEGKVTEATKKEIIALYEEMNALEKTISKYSRLETQLLGTANAYEKFQEAQELDSDTDYISSVEEMAVALGKAFNTAELGTESAKAAIAGLVPESVYKDLDTVEEKAAAIYDYFKGGKLSQYLDITLDDDGNIESAEMKLGNLRKFIEDGLWGDNNEDGINVFEGTDWQHFEFSQSFLDGLDGASDKLQYFADQMGVSKEIAFAFIESMNDHDADWLNGDYSSMFDMLTPESLENSIYRTTQAIAELNVKLANGEISAAEYQEAMYGSDGLSGSLSTFADKARNDAAAWYENTEKLEEYKTTLEDLNNQLETGKDKDGNVIDPEKVKEQVEETTGHINTIVAELGKLEEPTDVTIQLALDDIKGDINKAKKELEDAGVDLEEAIEIDSEGKFSITTGFEGNKKLEEYVDLLNEEHTLEVNMGAETPDVISVLSGVNDTLTNIQKLLEHKYNLQVNTDGAVTSTSTFAKMWDGIEDKSVTLWATVKEKVISFFTRTPNEDDAVQANGTANAHGTAFSGGSWGAPRTETALTGELGPEILVRNGRWTTVGENGAEFTDIRKGDIIFNHKQSEQLLKNGYVTSRGKAYAGGTAYKGGVTIYGDKSTKTQWEGTGYSGPYDSTYDLSESLNDASDSASEFAETFDWVAVRIEEITDKISLNEAKLDNAIGITNQNKIIDEMIGANQVLRTNLLAGANEYYAKAKTYLSKIPKEYRDAAKDGSIALTDFKNEVGEEAYNAIEEYREWVQKGDDLTLQAEQTLTDISDLAKQAIDNIATKYDNKTSLKESKKDQLEAQNDYFEETTGFQSSAINNAIIKENNKIITDKTTQRDLMQSELNSKVESGEIKKYSQAWYDTVNAISALDTEIINLKKDNEDLLDENTEIYWEQFDLLIDKYESVNEQANNLIDILSNEDLFDDSGAWTDAGITSLGLYAQQMEVAQKKAEEYKNQISYLDANWQKLGYTEKEYLAKRSELEKSQASEIKAYNDSKKAIVDLNKERVNAIKNGIQKEIDAYDELIEKKKEELDAEQDLYDFQKKSAESAKNIADIERKLAALAGDNSASAVAQRKKLEAELAEARAEQDDFYYQRSIENQKNALDNEKEAFTEAKNAEIATLEESLENTSQIVSDSIGTVRDSASTVLDTINQTASEYGLTLSDTLVKPWEDAKKAIQAYDDVFGISGSGSKTTKSLDSTKSKQTNTQKENDNKGTKAVKDTKTNSADYKAATKKDKKENKDTKSDKKDTKSDNKDSKTIKEGGKIDAKGAKIYGSKGAKSGSSQYFASDPIYTVLDIDGSWLKVRHYKAKSGTTGWFKKSDVKAYAKGSLGVSKNQLALIDELGEELQLVPGQNGRLEYVKKGTGIVPADLTERLMDLAMNPQDVLDRNRPSIAPSKSVMNNNTEISIDASVGTLLHVEHLDGNNPDEVIKIVNKAWDKKMQGLNNSIKKFSR